MDMPLTQVVQQADRLAGVFGPPRRRWGPADALHLKGELRMGAGRIRLWCVCGWKWEGETKDADAAWEGHL